MEIGVSTASLFMREYNEDAVKTLDEAGAKVCEVFLQTFSEYKREFGELLLKRKGNLKVHSVHVCTMNYETELFSINPRAVADVYPVYESVLCVAKLLGASCYTMHGRARIKKSGDYDDYKKAGERLNELSRKASEYGVSLCLENVEWAFYNRPGFFKEVKKFAPLLKGTLDVKQARLSGYDYGEYLDEMQSDIKTVHLSDVTDSGKICLPGKGTYDFEGLFKRLKNVGFNGEMLIEVYKNDYKEISEISQSLDYLRELKYKIF